MANHVSAQKRIRQTIKKTERNRHVRSTVRGVVKKVRTALAAGNKKEAKEAFVVASRRIDMAVSKGVYPRKTGSRYIARLAEQVAALK